MLELCFNNCHSCLFFFPWKDIVIVIVSILAFLIALHTYNFHTKPVLIFYLDANERHYVLKNVSQCPALNIVVAYNIKEVENELGEWINPVKIYSLAPDDTYHVSWGLDNEDINQTKLFLVEEKKNENILPKKYLKGVSKIIAIYSSPYRGILGDIKYYTTICKDEDSEQYEGKKISFKEEYRSWMLRRKEDAEKKSA